MSGSLLANDLNARLDGLSQTIDCLSESIEHSSLAESENSSSKPDSLTALSGAMRQTQLQTDQVQRFWQARFLQDQVIEISDRFRSEVHLFQVRFGGPKAVAATGLNGGPPSLSTKELVRLVVEASASNLPLSSVFVPGKSAASALANDVSSERGGATVYAFVTTPPHQASSLVMIMIASQTDPVERAAAVLQEFPTKFRSVAEQYSVWRFCQTGLKTRSRNKWLATVSTRYWIWACAILLGVVLFYPVPYRPTRDCKFEPAFRHYVSAPVDGILKTTLVRTGERVEQGQLLAFLDDKQLRRDLAVAEADYQAAAKRRDIALASRIGGELRIAQLEQQQAELKIASIEERLGLLEIRSPVAGLVIQGDWLGSEGKPVASGESLFEISDLRTLIAEVELEPRDIGRVGVGTQVIIQSDMNGSEAIRGTIQRIESRATVVDSKCIFYADVGLPSFDEKLRPGLKAKAKLVAGKRSIVRQLFQQPYEWLMNLWVW